jgi:CheY-like chemotaxis protein
VLLLRAMVRGALSALLSRERDIEVVSEVARGDEVVPAALATQPDIALLDIEMPGGDGLTTAQALHKVLPTCRCVILTTFGRSGYLRRAMVRGTVGFLLKDAPGAELAIALRRVMAGERVVDPDLALSALSDYSPGHSRHSCIAPLVQGVMAVGIEPQTMPEGRLLGEVLFGHTLEIVEEPAVRFLQLSQDLGDRHVSFLFRYLRIEGIDASKLDVARWSASGEDERQILQGLLLEGWSRAP